jgi:hypothetical protein
VRRKIQHSLAFGEIPVRQARLQIHILLEVA